MKWIRALRSKTVGFGLLLAVLGAVQTFLPQFQQWIDPTWYGPVTGMVGITVIVLRHLTTQPLTEK